MVDTTVTSIDKSPEEAIKQHDAIDPRTLCIYTDGSGIDGHVGAAAVVLNMPVEDVPAKRTKYMGTTTTSTVYAAELRGIELAFQMHSMSTRRQTHPVNASSSLTTRPPSRPWPTPNALRDSIFSSTRYDVLDQLRDRGWEVQLRGFPHMSVFPAMKRLTELRRKLQVKRMERVIRIPVELELKPLRTLTATTKSTIRQTMKAEWEQSWETAKHGRELFQAWGSVREKGSSQHIWAYTERSARSSHRCATAKSACALTFTPSTRPTPTNANAAMDVKRYDTSYWNAETGVRNDKECGQAKLHAWTSSRFSAARQSPSVQQR